MTKRSFGAILLIALAAGLIGGLLTATFHWFLTEPVLQRAIDIEESMAHSASGGAMPEVVSRPVQRIGLFIGYLIYGAAWGVMFGVMYWFVAALTPRRLLGWLALILAGLGGWAVGVLPQLKFPSNPPGIESIQPVDQRQNLYFGFLLLSLLGILVAGLVYRYLGGLKNKAWQPPLRRILVLTPFYLGFVGLIILLFPPITIIESMPNDLLTQFRVLSLVGVILFWVAIGGTYTLIDRFLARSKQQAQKAALV